MNTFKSITFVSMMLMSAATLAQVNISIPDTVQILVANGVKPHISGGLFDSEKTLQLPDGQQQVVFRYEPYFQQGKDNIGVESDVIIATFNETGKTLSFQLPKYRNARDAQIYIHDFQWSLTDKKGTPIHLIKDKLLKEGMQIGRNYYTETAIYNQSAAIASVVGFAPQGMQVPQNNTMASPKPQPKVVHKTQTTAAATTPETMLYYWYDQADEATKARFKQFINQQ